MPLIKWHPLKELEEMRRDMDRLFEEFKPSLHRRKTEEALPVVDMFDREHEIVVRAEVPGVNKEDIDLAITKESLTIRGSLPRDAQVKDEDYYISERVSGAFSRTISLPFEVESEQAKASLENGVLEIVMPKKEEARPKEIRIEVK